MFTDPYTPEHPDFDTLETLEQEPAETTSSAPAEDQARDWTNKALFDCYND
jgi:hypothetical protein